MDFEIWKKKFDLAEVHLFKQHFGGVYYALRSIHAYVDSTSRIGN